MIELMVVICILVILASILVPYVARVRETDRRARCADNLRALRAALQEYAQANNNNYPRVVYDAAGNPNGYAVYTGADSPSPFAPETTVKPNDVTASLWLLVRQELIGAKDFVCPGSRDSPQAASGGRSNFSSGKHLSYSYSSPFTSAPGYQMNSDWLKHDFAVMADMSPGVRGDNDQINGPAYTASPMEVMRANSNNHGKVGQNVLYGDGHVQFQITPYCAVGHEDRRDNIYTALSSEPLAAGNSPPAEGTGFWGPNIGPSWSADSYLVPTDDE